MRVGLITAADLKGDFPGMTAHHFSYILFLFRANLFSPIGSRARLIVLRHPNKIVSQFIVVTYIFCIGKSGVENHKTRLHKASSLNVVYQSHYLSLPLTVSGLFLEET